MKASGGMLGMRLADLQRYLGLFKGTVSQILDIILGI
jgi:hypothetical protein